MTSIKISTRYAAYLIFCVATLLIFAHILFQTLDIFILEGRLLPGIVERFNVDNEQSIPTWFAQTSLFAGAVLLAIIALNKQQIGDRFTRHWYILAGIFAYLSLDEGATLHETIGDLVASTIRNLPDFLYFAWVIPFGFFALAIAIGYWRFLLHLSNRERLLFIVSGLLYVGGALGMEMIGATILGSELPHAYYLLSVTVEEALELYGVSLFVVTLLAYIANHQPKIDTQVGS